MVDGVVVSGWLMEGPGVFSWSGEWTRDSTLHSPGPSSFSSSLEAESRRWIGR